MKILLGELKNTEEPLMRLMQNELPISLSYKLSKLLKEITNEFKNLEEQRIKLIKKYTDENNVEVKEENKDKFNIEFNELINIEVDLKYEPIEIKLSTKINISTFDLILLEKLFTFVE